MYKDLFLCIVLSIVKLSIGQSDSSWTWNSQPPYPLNSSPYFGYSSPESESIYDLNYRIQSRRKPLTSFSDIIGVSNIPPNNKVVKTTTTGSSFTNPSVRNQRSRNVFWPSQLESWEGFSSSSVSDEDVPYVNIQQGLDDSPYGLIHEEISDSGVPAVTDLRSIPKDVDPKDVWLSDGNLLILKGGTTSLESGFDDPWPMLDNYIAPYRKPVLVNINDPNVASGFTSSPVRFKIFKPNNQQPRQPYQDVNHFTKYNRHTPTTPISNPSSLPAIISSARQPKVYQPPIRPSIAITSEQNKYLQRQQQQYFKPINPTWNSNPIIQRKSTKNSPVPSTTASVNNTPENVQYIRNKNKRNLIKSIFKILT